MASVRFDASPLIDGPERLRKAMLDRYRPTLRRFGDNFIRDHRARYLQGGGDRDDGAADDDGRTSKFHRDGSTFDTTVGDDGGVSQTFRMSGVPGAGVISGAVSNGSEAIISTSGEVSAFAGLRDDHFFFDAVGFQNFLAAPCVPVAGLRCEGGGEPDNFFGSFNTATIVVEFPTVALPGISAPDSGNISIWAKSFEQQ